MSRSYSFFPFLAVIFLLVSPRTVPAQPVDVFPLAVGNQWTYRYDMSSADLFQDLYTWEFGTARYTVLNRIESRDSTRWVFEEFLDVNHCFRYYFPPHGDTCYRVLRSTQCEIVEMHEGQHRLWRQGMFYDVWSSVFPFAQELTDTTAIYRYQPVDSTLTHTFETHPPGEYPPMTFFLSFNRDSGLVRTSAETRFLVGSIDRTDHRLLSAVIVGVDDEETKEEPEAFALSQNYPNPFNPVTTFTFDIQHSAFIILKVYDLLGREVATLVNEKKEPGTYTVPWDASNMASGVYFCRLAAPHFVQTRKVLLMR